MPTDGNKNNNNKRNKHNKAKKNNKQINKNILFLSFKKIESGKE